MVISINDINIYIFDPPLKSALPKLSNDMKKVDIPDPPWKFDVNRILLQEEVLLFSLSYKILFFLIKRFGVVFVLEYERQHKNTHLV